MRAVIDTNVLLVANGAHAGVSPDCVLECIERLEALMKHGRVVIDDAHLILGEYKKRTSPVKTKGVGDVFLKWLLQRSANPSHVEQVPLKSSTHQVFENFPDEALQAEVDPPDRVFLATAAEHPQRPRVWQAADCKWLDWAQRLKAAGVTVEFLCPNDVCRIYKKKFPQKALPLLP